MSNVMDEDLKLSTPSHGLFSLSWPIFIDLSMHFCTMIINTIMVGMLSLQAVAEMNVGAQIFQLAFTLFNFINIGVCVCCAQALGNGNKSMVRRIVHMSLGMNIVWSIVITALTFFGAGIICDLMNIPEDIYDTSKKYLMLLCWLFIAEAINLCAGSILRAFGRTRDPMYITMLANVLTIVGNYILLFGHFGAPKLGIYGVAVSTIFARYLVVFLSLYLMLKHTKIKIVPRFMFVIKKKILKQILSIGLPGAGENLTWMLQFLFMTSIVGTFGSVALATHGIYGQLCGIIMLFSISVAMGTEIIIAHYAGAMKLKLAYKQLMRSLVIGESMTILLVINIPLWLGAALLSLFTKDPEVLALARPIFYVSLVMECGRILNIIIINSLRAVGDTKFPVFMAVLSMWGVSVPLGSFLGVHAGLGLLGIWIGFCADECTRGIAMFIRWKSKSWVKSAIKNYKTHYMKRNRVAKTA